MCRCINTGVHSDAEADTCPHLLGLHEQVRHLAFLNLKCKRERDGACYREEWPGSSSVHACVGARTCACAHLYSCVRVYVLCVCLCECAWGFILDGMYLYFVPLAVWNHACFACMCVLFASGCNVRQRARTCMCPSTCMPFIA
jgi:hypothetical protein